MIKNTLFNNSQKGDYYPSMVDYIILDDRYTELSFEWFISGKWRWEIAKLKVRCLLKLSNSGTLTRSWFFSGQWNKELYRHPQKHSKYACILWFTLRCVPRVFLSLLRYLCHLINSLNMYLSYDVSGLYIWSTSNR